MPLSPLGAFSQALSPLHMVAPNLNGKLSSSKETMSPLMAKPRFGQQLGARKMNDYQSEFADYPVHR